MPTRYTAGKLLTLNEGCEKGMNEAYGPVPAQLMKDEDGTEADGTKGYTIFIMAEITNFKNNNSNMALHFPNEITYGGIGAGSNDPNHGHY